VNDLKLLGSQLTAEEADASYVPARPAEADPVKYGLVASKEAGFVEGENVNVEYRSAENEYERLPLLIAPAVKTRGIAVAAAFAAKAAFVLSNITATLRWTSSSVRALTAHAACPKNGALDVN
jgi:hypothetical protein